MASLRPFTEQLCFKADCRKPATDELLTRWGEHRGYYCEAHGNQAFNHLQARERALELKEASDGQHSVWAQSS